MKHHLLVIVAVITCGLAAAMLIMRMKSDGNTAELPDAAAAAERSTSSAAAAEIGNPERDARIKELEKMALARQLRDEAAKKNDEARSALQQNKQGAWTKVVGERRQLFEELRRKAAQAPNKLVPCTICDTKGILDFCVICDHSGKCPDCKGIGQNVAWVCPTCQGTGKCFYCNGLGKMPCPFCQSSPLRKEIITPDTPNPPNEIPIR